MAFFEASSIPTVKQLPTLIPRCGDCGLFRTCKSPYMKWSGLGRKGILIVAEAPGEEEDNRGTQFVGKAGQYLRDTTKKFGVDLDEDCWKTNALICRPPENETPTSDQIDDCRPNLLSTLKLLRPRVVILLGAPAVRSYFGLIWKEDTGSITQWAGWRIPLQKHNCWVVPNRHPSYVNRTEDERIGPVTKLWFEEHLKRALELEGRPWPNGVPNYKDDIELIFDPTEAAKILREFIRDGGAVSFDFETNMLKPDRWNAEIVSCAVCWRGRRTIAYPWAGDAIKATSELLLSPCPKLGANKPFETRWTRAILKHDVVGWEWDCCDMAHMLDNRRDITSVKFQALIRLGIEPWNEHLEPYMTAVNPNGTNDVKLIDKRSLLMYNGEDALYEFKICVNQKQEFERGLRVNSEF